MEKDITSDVISKIVFDKKENRIPKRLVNVNFFDGSCLVYFSDVENIKQGNLVFVEGKKQE